MSAIPPPSTTAVLGGFGSVCPEVGSVAGYPNWSRRTLAGAGGVQEDGSNLSDGRRDRTGHRGHGGGGEHGESTGSCGSQCSESEGVRFLAEPPADLAAVVREWREAGVSRLVCGFLPDEAAWPMACGDVDFAWFVTHWEFLPFRFARQVAGSAERVVLATDSTVGVEPLGEVIAQAWADAAGLKLDRLDISRGDEASITSTLARAALVVNDVQDWSTGFAIDELAARLGRQVLRLRQPGYSPLRHALLGQQLPAREFDRDQSLRALLTAPLAAARERLRPYGNSWWFAGGAAAQVWREVFGPAAAAFWRGVNWTVFCNGAAAGEGRFWTNRAAGWAACAMAVRRSDFPEAAREHLGTLLACSLTQELRGRVPGAGRDLALPRWVRWCPEWICQYGAAIGESAALRLALAGWVARGLVLGDFGEPMSAVVRAASKVLGPQECRRANWAPILAWSADWGRGIPLPEGDQPLAAWLRGGCAEAFWSGLAQVRGGMADRGGTAVAGLLADSLLWSRTFGAAAPFLRILAAVESGQLGIARSVWREEARAAGVRTSGGLAALLRAALPSVEALRAWVGGVARSGGVSPVEAVLSVFESWARARRFQLWSCSPSPQVVCEVEMGWQLWCAAAGKTATVGAAYWSLGARLAAWSGLALEAERAVAAYAAREPTKAGDLSALVSLALVMREERSAARRLLDVSAATQPGGPMLVFVRAVAAELLGECSRAGESLRKLRELDPGFFAKEQVADSRWIWAGIVFRTAGRKSAAACCARIAAGFGALGVRMLESVPWGEASLAGEWADFIPEAGQP